jgi:hypothetical protein
MLKTAMRRYYLKFECEGSYCNHKRLLSDTLYFFINDPHVLPT